MRRLSSIDRAVIVLHELLDGEVVIAVAITERLAERALVIEQQPVLAPPGQLVQREADAPQQRLALDQGLILGLGQKTVVHQIVQGFGAEMALGDPADHLDVAQPAGVLLDVGFQVVGGVVVFVPAGALLEDFGREETLASARCAPGRSPRAWPRTARRCRPAARDSMRLVTTVTSLVASRTQSSTVRTLCPTSRPMSHRKVTSRSSAFRNADVRRGARAGP